MLETIPSAALVCLRVPEDLPPAPRCREPEPDLADVYGQQRARRALEVAVAGGHNLLTGCR